MIPHGKETPEFTYDFATERKALRATKAHRNIPAKDKQKLLAATWNLTNFGAQERTENDIKLMAEIVGWFDIVAIQEVADDLDHLRLLLKHLPKGYATIISDIGGNDERAGFIYDSAKVKRLELAAEVAIPPSDHRYIRMKEVSGSFTGFDRNPYIVAFKAGKLEFTAVSAHLYFGSNSYFNRDRRALEAYALARWAGARHKSPGAYSNNILVMGDLNLPKVDSKSHVYKALIAKGLMLPVHSTSMGSSLKGDKAYDQVAFHAGVLKDAYIQSGVFDFDRKPFFAKAWDRSKKYFKKSIKYHIADHRPLWTEFKL